MANEISLQALLTTSKNGVTISGSVSKAITQTGDQAIGNVQIIGTATEALVLGDVTTIGYIYLKNMDATNFVSFGLNTPVAGDAFCKLLPGEAAVIPTRQTTIYAIADTAPVNVNVVAVEL